MNTIRFSLASALKSPRGAPAASVKRAGYSKQEFLTGIFTVADFPLPSAGQYGNLGRNTFRGPGFARIDVSLGKSFRITERVAAALRLEALQCAEPREPERSVDGPQQQQFRPHDGHADSTEPPGRSAGETLSL